MGTLHLTVNVLACFWKSSCLLKLKKIYSFPRGRTQSGHTWSTVKKFLILDLSSLHPCGKPYLGYAARPWLTLLGDGCTQLGNCSATHHGGRTMSWTARLWCAPARISSRRRCTTGTRCLGTSCGGYDPGYPLQTTWAAPPGAAQPTR